MFSAPALESELLQVVLVLFHNMILETEIWVPGGLIATGVPLLLGLLADKARKYMCVY